MLPLNFFFEPVLSVISLTPTVLINKISLALKQRFRHTNFGHSFGLSWWISLHYSGWSLSGSKNETSRLLTYKIFWWKKITSFNSSKRTVQEKFLTFALKILRFAEYRQLTKSCWDKKSMKRKTLHGIRYINKKIKKQDDPLL